MDTKSKIERILKTLSEPQRMVMISFEKDAEICDTTKVSLSSIYHNCFLVMPGLLTYKQRMAISYKIKESYERNKIENGKR